MSRILVAEDSPAIRLLLVRRLELVGHRVTAVQDGDEALQAMLDAAPGEKPDLVLVDAMMPGADGAEVLESIKRSDPEIPVIVVSAMQGLARSPEWAAADAHVRKPIDFDGLLGHIEELTSGPPRP